jgi:transposase-like protein
VAKKARRRYTDAEKKRILGIAEKEGLTGADVQKRFGIAQLTFYRWRGPVRGPKARARAAQEGGLTRAAKAVGRTAGRTVANLDTIREEVRSGVRAVIPNVIREEVANYLSEILGRRGPGRPRGARRGPGRPPGSGRKPGRPKGSGRGPGRPPER